MSLQVSAGYGSLLALGVGAGDVATIYSLGRRVGNWWTAASGDEEFLRLLDQDELDLLTRRGVFDTLRFNKTWNTSMTLLTNGKKVHLKGEQAHKVLGELSRFTAYMVCIIASLDAFVDYTTSRTIIRELLLELLKTTEHGEGIVGSELSNRINAWRSAACVRGVHKKVREIRFSMVKAGKILNGTLPPPEGKEVLHFLHWLIAENTPSFRTPSSDLAGIAYCLSSTGFDLLSVDGIMGSSPETSCRLVYDTSQVLKTHHQLVYEDDLFAQHPRGLCTTVSLDHPEEAMSTFPISQDIAHRCRYSWKRGLQAAKKIKLHLTSREPKETRIPNDLAAPQDLRYEAVDMGTVPDRSNSDLWMLTSAFGFAMNQELITSVEDVMNNQPEEIASWLLEQTDPKRATELTENSTRIAKPITGTEEQIDAFTIFQAFFMGYYYEVFLRLVDTSWLQLAVVDGAWGFRSRQLLIDTRNALEFSGPTPPKKNNSTKARCNGIPRQTLLEILSSMLCSKRVSLPYSGAYRDCIGVIGKRTLLCTSLLKDCSTPDEIGEFILLDIDVGGLPSDINGLIRCGMAQKPTTTSVPKKPTQKLVETGPDEDCTRHIEADWDVDPNTALLCIRYKGRRLVALNVAEADWAFFRGYVMPVPEPRPVKAPKSLPAGVTIDDLIAGTIPDPTSQAVFAHAYGAPCLRYAFAGVYSNWPVAIASNCLDTAWQEAILNTNRGMYEYVRDRPYPVAIAGAGPGRSLIPES